MIIEIHIPDSLIDDPRIGRADLASFGYFLQQMANHIVVGHLRYGRPHRRKKYVSRLTKELNVYLKSGNHQQLLNIANYAWLESEKPENPNYHHNPYSDSVTRKEFGV